MIKILFYSIIDLLYVLIWQLRALTSRRNVNQYLQSQRPDRLAVIVIPGVFETWRFMQQFCNRLYKAGYRVHVIDELNYNDGSIPLSALAVQGFMESLDAESVILIGHSKGGLIGKYLLANYDHKAKVKHLIAINTPFSGSLFAHFVWLPALRTFRPDNKIIRELGQNEQVNSKITYIYSQFDPYIPVRRELKSADNIKIDSIGHFRILSDARLYETILGKLEQYGSNK